MGSPGQTATTFRRPLSTINARTPSGRGHRGFTAGVGLLVTASCVVGVHSSAAGASGGASYVPVARYWPGSTVVDGHKHTWLPDAQLHAGGRVERHSNIALLRDHPRLRLGRVATSTFSVPVTSSGRYRITWRYLTCNAATKQCSIGSTDAYVSLGAAGRVVVRPPAGAKQFGVSTIVVSKRKPNPPSKPIPARTLNGAPSAPTSKVPTSAPASTASPSTTPVTSAAPSSTALASTTPVLAPPTTPSPATMSSADRAAALQLPPDVVNSTSTWRQNVSLAPLATNSAAMAQNLATQVTSYYNGVAAVNAYQYNTSWYTVSANQPTTTLRFSDCQHKGYTPYGMFGTGGQFVDVPIPDNAVTSVGSDHELSIYRPSTDQLWDFWVAGHDANGWYACWGGRLDHVSQSDGYFRNGYGATATGLASELGAISIGDVRRGSINHAMALAIPTPAVWYNYSWPAQRGDGPAQNSDPNAIPEGSRLRLDPTVNVDALHLTPLAAMIAKAAQRYGFIITDRSGCVAVSTESGLPTKQITGSDPWDAILGKTPTYSVLANFPWNRMQFLPKDYGKH